MQGLSSHFKREKEEEGGNICNVFQKEILPADAAASTNILVSQWRCKIEAAQSSLLSPSTALLTALALFSPKATSRILLAYILTVIHISVSSDWFTVLEDFLICISFGWDSLNLYDPISIMQINPAQMSIFLDGGILWYASVIISSLLRKAAY